MFFFSSRRRHTRYIGDWSSDVCSSDLFPFGDRADHHQRIAIVNGPAVVAYVARERIAGRHAQRELGAALGAVIERRERHAAYDSGRRISAGSSARLPMT